METGKLLQAIDKMIDGFTLMEKEEFKLPMQQIITGLIEMKQFFQELDGKPIQVQSVSDPEELDSFEKIRKGLESDRWPAAVNPNFVCDPNSKLDKIERGRGIIESTIDEDLKGKKLLDIGCGEGHVVLHAIEKQCSIAVGYDIKDHNWDQMPKTDAILFTTDFEAVKASAPYDVIILFDVIDHIKGIEPIELLKKAKEVLADNGKIYVRFHPFTSRHATHLYHDLNKAYVHLVFTEEELKTLIPESKYAEPSLGVIYPINTYTHFITEAGLKIVSKRETKETVEPFFKIPKIAKRIMERTKSNKFPEFQLGLQFIDMILSK